MQELGATEPVRIPPDVYAAIQRALEAGIDPYQGRELLCHLYYQQRDEGAYIWVFTHPDLYRRGLLQGFEPI